ncbi:MAG: enolase C-terminal domain-like protein, partial [Victivallales bacterium]
KIKSFNVDFSREQFVAPFGFKGAYLSEMWQSSVSLAAENGKTATGYGAQSVLWSDPEVFTHNPEAAGNAMMLMTTSEAARAAVGKAWKTPLDLQKKILGKVHRRAAELTGRKKELRLTFTLNSMVALDNAAWLLMSKEKGISSFEEMIPADLRSVFSAHQEKVGLIPLISYGVPVTEVSKLLEDGCCLLKIKVGSDPEKDGDKQKMLEWDKRRISEIHAAACEFRSQHTKSGNIMYYLDANGRYDSIGRVRELLDHAGKIGALDRIILFEEPFPEEMKEDVSTLPVRIAADESAHSVEDVEERIALGYGAIALKPIAKTLSMSLLMLKAAKAHGVPCFCADLTVTPVLVEWNKNVAARLDPLPEMKIGAMETNGSQNYRNWRKMLSQLAVAERPWVEARNGVFSLDADYYARSGGIFEDLRA